MADQQQPHGLDLPPGFRFHPSDFEIVNHYLKNKVHDEFFTCTAIGEVDLNNTEPWDLPNRAKWGKKEWYFFYKKDRKYPTGLRANRATKAGYWKATGKDQEVYDTTEGVVLLVGMKKTLVFYQGRAPRGDKTNWVMHEYRLEGNDRIPSPASASSSSANAAMAMKASTSTSKDEWAVCRVFQKTNGIKKTTAPAYQVAVDGAEIQQNQNNILPISIPMPLQLPLPMPTQQFPILPDFTMDPVAPYYPNASVAMPPMASIGSIGGLQINDALFDNLMAALPQMNFYHQMGTGAAVGQMGIGAIAGQMDIVGAATGQMGMGATVAHMDIGVAVAQMDMGAAGAGGFDIVAAESTPPSSMVSQKDEQANAADISSMMSMTGPGFATTTIEMDGIWKYKY